MTQTSYFWDGTTTGDKGPYSGDTFSDFIRKLFIADRTQQGVLEGYGGQFSASGVTSPVTLTTGAALVDGKFYESDANETVAIPTPATGNRIDRIVLRKAFSAQTVRLTRIAGVEGSGSPPALTQSDGSTWDILLWQVYINTLGQITNLVDERYYVYTANASVWRADNDGPDSGLNADLLDDAHKSVDDTLAGDSDYLIPSESAVNGFVREKYINPSIYVYRNAISYPSGGQVLPYNGYYRNDGQSILTFDSGTNSLKALVAGMFLVTAHAHIYTTDHEDSTMIWIKKNGTDYITGGSIRNLTQYEGERPYPVAISVPIYMAANDYVQVVGEQYTITGTPYTRIAAASATTPGYNGFSMTRM